MQTMRIELFNNLTQNFNIAESQTANNAIVNETKTAFTEKIISNTPSFSTWTSAQPGKLFEDTSNQTYMGKERPKLFACNDAFSYYQQMCLAMPQLFGDGTSTSTGTDSYTGDSDFSTIGPTGTDIYTKPDDGGSHDKIAVIDAFNSSNPEVCMNVDSTTNTTMPHGEFVASLIESQLAENGLNYSVDRLGVDIVDGVLQGGVEQMDHVLANADQYRAVNVSLCEYCDYDLVSAAIGKTISSSNLAENKSLIMSTVMSDEVTELYSEYSDVLSSGYLPDFTEEISSGNLTQAQAEQIEALLTLRYKVETLGEFYSKADQVASLGIPVFMAAGNYEDQFNFGALLTSKVEYIGSENEVYTNPHTGGQGSFSDNTLVSRYGKESYSGTQVINGKIDVDGNGTGDIDATGVDSSTFFATGTSFASPWALVQALNQADTGSGTSTASVRAASNTAVRTSSGGGTLLDIMKAGGNRSTQQAANTTNTTQNTTNTTTESSSESSDGIHVITTGDTARYQALRAKYAEAYGIDVMSEGSSYYSNGVGSTYRYYVADPQVVQEYLANPSAHKFPQKK